MVTEKENISLTEQITGIFIKAPSIMKDLCKKPKILFPVLLLLFAQPIFYIIRYPAYLKFIEKSSGQSDPNILNQIAISGIFAHTIKNILVWIISSLLMLGFVKIIQGAGTFKQILSVNGYAYLAIIPGMIIMIIVGQFTGDLLIDFSPAFFFQSLKGTVLYGVLRSFCLFFVWQHILMAIGFYVVSKSKKSILIVILVYILELFMNLPNLMVV